MSNPEPECEPGWCISPIDGVKRKTVELLDREGMLADEGKNCSGEASQPTVSDTTISAVEEAAIRAEVREIMQKKFAAGRATLGTNPGSHYEDSVKSGAAIPSASVIDLVTESTQPSGRITPSVILGSPVSVASTPSHAGNGGSAPGFSHLTHFTTTASPQKFLPRCTRSLKSLRAFSDAARRMSIRGHPWCVTTYPSWEVVTSTRSRMQYPLARVCA